MLIPIIIAMVVFIVEMLLFYMLLVRQKLAVNEDATAYLPHLGVVILFVLIFEIFNTKNLFLAGAPWPLLVGGTYFYLLHRKISVTQKVEKIIATGKLTTLEEALSYLQQVALLVQLETRVEYSSVWVDTENLSFCFEIKFGSKFISILNKDSGIKSVPFKEWRVLSAKMTEIGKRLFLEEDEKRRQSRQKIAEALRGE